jgi:hypothetical protein
MRGSSLWERLHVVRGDCEVLVGREKKKAARPYVEHRSCHPNRVMFSNP